MILESDLSRGIVRYLTLVGRRKWIKDRRIQLFVLAFVKDH
jgi:hypothetical protein